MAHSKLAPSSAARRMACPGSRKLEAQYPETEESKAAREGHAAHWLAQQYLLGDESDFVLAPNGEEITDEMVEGAELYLAEVFAVSREDLHIEEKISIWSVHEECWGTPDCWVIKEDVLYLFDYKFGYGYVEVFENWQLLEYAAGIASCHDFKKVTMTIVQPRCYTPEGKVRSWTISRNDLVHDYVRRLQESEAFAMHENPPCRPSPQCVHCKGRHACSALQKTVARDFDVIEDYPSHELNPHETGVELKRLHAMAQLLEARITGLEEQARSMIMRGDRVSGYKLEPGNGRDQWTASAAEIITMGELLGLDLSKPTEAITPAQARKLGVDDALLKIYSERVPGKLKLVEYKSEKIFGGGY